MPYFVARTHSGPAPNMNSAFLEIVQGFLNRRSTSHSVEEREKSGVTPASSSSRFSIGVTSTAAVGPKLDPPALKFQFAAPPSSTTATGSFSTDCAKTFPALSNKNAMKTGFVTFTGSSRFARICVVPDRGYHARFRATLSRWLSRSLLNRPTFRFSSNADLKARVLLPLADGTTLPPVSRSFPPSPTCAKVQANLTQRSGVKLDGKKGPRL